MFLLEVVKSFEADQVKICFKKYESTRRIKIREVSKKISPLSAAMWIEERKKNKKTGSTPITVPPFHFVHIKCNAWMP